MKKIPAFIFYIFLLTLTIERSYGQTQTGLQEADSFFLNKNWAAAKEKYTSHLGDDSSNSQVWNRLGYCNQNMGLYSEAIRDYNKSLSNNPSPQIKNIVFYRLASVYSLMNKTEDATDWLVKSTMGGYNSLNDLDSLETFKNLRASSNFREIRQKIYEIIYPCSRNPRNRDFDFWIGDWNCYRTGTNVLSGYSHVEVMSGGCAILENYTSTQAYTGKSFNYYDTATGKWEQLWIGSGGPGDRQRYLNGEFKNGAMHFTYETTSPQGEKQKGTFIFYSIDKDTVRQYQDITDDNGKTISVTYDLTYRRKK